MRRLLINLSISVFLISALIASGCKDFKTLGNPDNPIVLKCVSSKSDVSAKKLSQLMGAYISKKTGLTIIADQSPDSISIIEGFEKSKVHVAFINTFGYLLAWYWGNASAQLCLIFSSGETNYKGQVITNINSSIKKPADISNRTFAFKDPYSTAGFVLPLKFLEDNKITPKKTVFAKSYYEIVLGVYKNKFDAGAIYYDNPDKSGRINDARKIIIADYPDVAKKVKLLAFTGTIKSSPVVFHREIPDELRKKLVNALLQFASEKEGREALKKAYDAIGLQAVTDNDYNTTRKLLDSIGKEAESLIPGGYKITIRKKLSVIVDNIYP